MQGTEGDLEQTGQPRHLGRVLSMSSSRRSEVEDGERRGGDGDTDDGSSQGSGEESGRGTPEEEPAFVHHAIIRPSIRKHGRRGSRGSMISVVSARSSAIGPVYDGWKKVGNDVRRMAATRRQRRTGTGGTEEKDAPDGLDAAERKPPLGASLFSQDGSYRTEQVVSRGNTTATVDFAATQERTIGAYGGRPGLAGVGTPRDASVVLHSTRASLGDTVASQSEASEDTMEEVRKPPIATGNSPDSEMKLGGGGGGIASVERVPVFIRASLGEGGGSRSSMPRTPVLAAGSNLRAATVVSSEDGTGPVSQGRGSRESAPPQRRLNQQAPSELPGFFGHFPERSDDASPRPSGLSERDSRRGSGTSPRGLEIDVEGGSRRGSEGGTRSGDAGVYAGAVVRRHRGAPIEQNADGDDENQLGSTLGSIRLEIELDGELDDAGRSAGMPSHEQNEGAFSRLSRGTGQSSPAQTHFIIPGERIERSPRTQDRIRKLQEEAVITEGGAKELPVSGDVGSDGGDSGELDLEAALHRLGTGGST